MFWNIGWRSTIRFTNGPANYAIYFQPLISLVDGLLLLVMNAAVTRPIIRRINISDLSGRLAGDVRWPCGVWPRLLWQNPNIHTSRLSVRELANTDVNGVLPWPVGKEREKYQDRQRDSLKWCGPAYYCSTCVYWYVRKIHNIDECGLMEWMCSECTPIAVQHISQKPYRTLHCIGHVSFSGTAGADFHIIMS